MSEHKPVETEHTFGSPAQDEIEPILQKVRACMQCGTCTGSCVNSHAMDHTPRELWRMVQVGMVDEIFASKTFWLCSSCYYCTLRCPRGLKLTEAMAELKRLAVARGITSKDKKSSLFYRAFLDSVRRYGRVREMEMMARYFVSLKDPFIPMGFTPLGLKLMMKGKLSPQMPSMFCKGKLDAIFSKVKELEASS